LCSIAKNDSLLYTRNSVFVKSPDALFDEPCDLRIGPMNTNETFILAHLSDPHLAYHHGIRLADFLNKRLFGYIKWRLRRKSEHHDDVLAEMIQDLKRSRPDHIVVTGDLTHLGLPAEFAKAKELLSNLGSPSQVTIIPGNHDAYVDGALDCRLSEWADYIVSDGLKVCAGTDTAVNAVFPSLRVRDPVALVGVSSAQPCSTFLAVGCIGDDQLQRLQKILIETGQKGLFRIVLIHHPPISGVVSWRKRLIDAEAFHEILQRCGAELILHGHAHHQSLSYIDIQGGRIPVIGVPSASAAGENTKRRAQYHLYRLSPQTDGWDLQVCVRRYLNKDQRFGTEDEYHLT
jgi:3',5'-cyclic AMP phosphodiesterase CpdA